MMGSEEIASGCEVTAEEQCGNDGSGHHLHIRLMSLRILLMVRRVIKLITEINTFARFRFCDFALD